MTRETKKQNLKTAFSKKRLAAVAVVFLMLGIAFLGRSPDINVDDFVSSQTQIELTGFTPSARVHYTVRAAKDRLHEESAQLDENGALRMEPPKNFAPAEEDMHYDVSIDDNGQKISVSLRRENESNKLFIQGRTRQPFSDVKISTNSESYVARSDWSGLFEHSGIQSDVKNINHNEIELAFYKGNIASDAQSHQNPAIIKVQIPGDLGPPPLADIEAATVDQIINNFVLPLQYMAEQITVVAAQQVFIIGTFFDAKDQLEVQREHQRLKAKAHKDYHPDQQMCRVGTFVRSIATNERKAIHDHVALNDMLMETYTNRLNMGSAVGDESYTDSRLGHYITTYCDPNDNNAGLFLLCEHPGGVGAADTLRRNKDIDYQRSMELFHTIEVNFTDGILTDNEEDILALARNIYWTDAFDWIDAGTIASNAPAYQHARQLMALSNVAHNSFAKQVSMKASSPPPPPGVTPGWAHMKTMMREFGMDDDNIALLMGENPSYHAQMEVLTRKMVQMPDFYTNLYMKPTNVDRMIASLQAISLMQQRDMHEVMLRREMLLSGMVESELMPQVEQLNGEILLIKKND